MIKIKESLGYRIFSVVNAILLFSLSIICVLPIIHILAVSLSDQGSANANLVGLWPKNATLLSFSETLRDAKLIRAFLVSLRRILVGVPVNMGLVLLCAFPLSFTKEQFVGRNLYMWILLFSMMFSGGLIPYYILMNQLGLMNTVWALVAPGLPVFSVVILMNFFRQLPKELSESAYMDGAGYARVLTSIYIPLATPAIITLVLFSFVHHWNSWFDGLIFMKDMENYPLQTYIQTLIARMNTSPDLEEAKRLAFISRRSILFAKIIVSIVPIGILYPYMQRYYQKGLILGSVKG
jgi:putative aldouronate transport system permease protein